ncbi:MAG: hypothetical protein FWD71_21400 [Oscillospiraceae bacterium]|nr:hypothetical protein [Oscillospiraceae bacterium]
MSNPVKPRLLVTHSLLNSWNYMLKNTEDIFDETIQKYINPAYDSFISTLNRVEVEPTEAMLV